MKICMGNACPKGENWMTLFVLLQRVHPLIKHFRKDPDDTLKVPTCRAVDPTALKPMITYLPLSNVTVLNELIGAVESKGFLGKVAAFPCLHLMRRRLLIEGGHNEVSSSLTDAPNGRFALSAALF